MPTARDPISPITGISFHIGGIFGKKIYLSSSLTSSDAFE